MRKIFIIILISLICGSDNLKARTIYAHINPGIEYDDLAICNIVGVYKTSGVSSMDLENEYLENLMGTPTEKKINLNACHFKIYPNPTQDLLNISYNTDQDAFCIIQDMTGREVQKIYLRNGIMQVTVDTKNLTSGVYHCVFYVGSNYLETQKLLKL